MRDARRRELVDSDAHDNEEVWQAFPARLAQVLVHAGVTQTELARLLQLSAGFVSEVCRGLKRPGADFFIGLHRLFGVSIDWLATGKGTMIGSAGIREDLFQAIRLQISVAKAAVNERDPVAQALLALIREGQLGAAASNAAFSDLLDRIAPVDADIDLAVELYNGHLWTADPIAQRRNMLAAAVAHFEMRRPIDRLAAMTGSDTRGTGFMQINSAKGQRVAGRDYHEHTQRSSKARKERP